MKRSRGGGAGFAILALLLFSCSRGGGEGGNADAPVVHLTSRGADVTAIEGIVTEIAPDVLLEQELNLDEGMTVVSLAWSPRPDSLRVTDAAGTQLESRSPAEIHGGASGFALVPLRRRLAAGELAGDAPSFAPTRYHPEFRPAHVALDAPRGATFVCTAPRTTLRMLVRAEHAGTERLSVTLDGIFVASLPVQGEEWQVREAPLAAEPGGHRIEISRGATAETDAPRIAWLELEQHGPPTLLLRGEAGTPIRITYDPRPPREREVLYPAFGTSKVHLFAVGGPVMISLRSGASLLWPPEGLDFLPESELPILVGPRGVYALEVAGGEAGVIVEQPAARLLPQAGDAERSLTQELDLASAPLDLDLVFTRMEIRGDRRTGFWLPASSSLELDARLYEGERLRFAVGLPDDPPPSPLAELEGSEEVDPDPPEVEFVVEWLPDSGGRIELDRIAIARSESWLDREVVIDTSRVGRGRLRFATSAGAPLPAGFADPRIVRDDVERCRPNVLVYLIDALRADHVSAYGARNLTTPHLDELAADGFLFTDFQAVAPWTRPTTATLLTGYYPSWHGMGKELPLPESMETLAETLRDAGYSTWAATANVQVGGRGLRFEQGFHRFVAQDAVAAALPPGTPAASSDRLHAVLAPWLETNGDEPFFLYVHSLDPHSPYAPPTTAEAPFGRDYDGKLRGEPLRPYRLRELTDQLDDADRRYVEDVYDNEIHHQDRRFQDLLDLLERKGIRDDTVIVVLSDHGEEFFDHGEWDHGYRMWQELLRVPLILWIPPRWRTADERVPRQIDRALSQVDFLPGLLDLLDVEDDFPRQGGNWRGHLRPPPLGTEGYDFSPILAEDWQTWEGDEIGSYRRGPHKLIWTLDETTGEAREMLFDLDADPRELRDRAGSEPRMVEDLRRLRDDLRRELRVRGDELYRTGRSPVVPPEGRSDEKVRLEADALRELRALGYLGEED